MFPSDIFGFVSGIFILIFVIVIVFFIIVILIVYKLLHSNVDNVKKRSVKAPKIPFVSSLSSLKENEKKELISAKDVNNCKYCGENIEENIAFCPYCGSNLASKDT
ncbi:MAG: zinc ribbon domain-containing protein [Candidatus Lokiarchaeota archaeon]|nr:zinc ribbon domain-containing protein [Candidatus Lokiarchaeota archaeon]